MIHVKDLIGSMQVDVNVTFPEGILGTAPGNPEIYKDFIIGKARKNEGADAVSKEAEKEELGTLPKIPEDGEKSVEDKIESNTTFFHHDPESDLPFIYDYQVKGFLKDAAKALKKIPEVMKHYKDFFRQYKSNIDTLVFVEPRRIPLEIPQGCEITINERPLRAGVRTAEGYKEIVALARSEQAPSGTKARFLIGSMNPEFLEPVKLILEYGELRGIGQWRNSGIGRFTHEITKEVGKAPKAKKASKKKDNAD